MIGLDTNILVRYLTQDDPVQSATEILELRLTPKNPGFVSVVALVETVWVLDRAYGLTAQEIATAVERLLQVEVLTLAKRAGSFHGHGRTKTGTWIICGRAYHRAWCAGRLHSHVDIRPRGGPASWIRACVIDPILISASAALPYSGYHHVGYFVHKDCICRSRGQELGARMADGRPAIFFPIS